MPKIKKGDEVIILTGKDKGKHGKVLRVVTKSPKKKYMKNKPKFNKLPDKMRVVVENCNLIKRHVKPNPQENVQGGIIEKEASIHVSNVAIYNTATSKGDRIKYKTLEDGRKVRIFSSNNEVIDI